MDAAIRKAKDSLGQIFDKNLHDLVRGIRNHKENESKYIAECIDEIKQELKQENISVKANAINKLCYLEMLGYDISWAAFNIIEVMSSSKFTYKVKNFAINIELNFDEEINLKIINTVKPLFRNYTTPSEIGYLTASQSFHEGTDVLMLTTNMIRKDLGSQNMFEAGVALSGLACFITPDLARDLANEIMILMTSNKPYLRKKAVLIMYKIFLKYPDALRPSFPRLKEKLDDPEPSVQAAAVNVICELARKNPHNYLSLAPIFFKLMTSSSNNWVLIKIIKLFGALTPLEPRLGKKLIEPLTNLINSTSAMSLLYECINTVLAVLISISSGQPNHDSAIQICLQKLRILIEDTDQNLKYLGLLAMSKILQTDPKSVQMHKDLIMQCLDDKDESIRLRSLDLLYGMVSKKNLMEIIKKLMVHMNKAEGTHYRDELLSKIVDICSQNNYQHVTNFEWYVTVLVELTRMEGTRHGKLLASQMLDVAIRVESIRPFIVKQMAILLDNIHVFTGSTLANNTTAANSAASNKNASDICEVLYAATWICGEFALHLVDPAKTMESMLKSKVTNLPGHIQSAFVQNVFKLYSHIFSRFFKESDKSGLSENDLDECKRLTTFVSEKIQIFEQSADIEVQERACGMLQILKYVQKILEKYDTDGDQQIHNELASLFEGELNPVAAKAQKKVPIPEGLNLDAWINEPSASDLEDNDDTVSNDNQIFERNDSKTNRAPQSFTSMSSANYGGSSNNYNGDSSTYNSTQNLGARKLIPELSQEDLAKYKESRKIQLDSNPFYIKGGSSVKKSESIGLMNNNNTEYNGNTNNASESIRTQSIDLKIPIIIPGVTSSDSYLRMSQIDQENKKLKKKMKNKKADKSKKKSSKKNQVEEDEEEDDDDKEGPVVKVLSNEMPEGAAEDSDDGKSKRDINDPHRALDVNLDEPLKDNERLPVPSHRLISPSESKNVISSSNSNKNQNTTDIDDSLKKSKSKDKKSSKNKDEVVDAKEKKQKSAKEKKDKKDKKSSKKEHNKSTSSDLLISNENTNRSENDYNELLSPENDDTKSIAQNNELKDNIKSKNNEQDDMDFWLSTTTNTDVTEKITTDIAEPSETKSSKKEKKKSSKSLEKDKENTKEKTKKKDKESKKDKSKNQTHILEENQNVPFLLSDNNNTNNKVNLITNGNSVTYKSVASNKHLKISCLIKPNHMNLNQVIVKFQISNIIKSNNNEGQIHSIELNIIDSAILKLVRDELNQSKDESILIPFNLMPNKTNEIELYFNVTDCTYPHKIKGTMTYMIKNEQDNGSVQDKIDFKLEFSCSVFLLQSPCTSDDFAKSLSSGQLNSKYVIKAEATKFEDIDQVVNFLRDSFDLTVVEIVDNSASLFSSSIQNHPICILVKLLSDKSVSIDGKSTNGSIVENLLEEFKSHLKPKNQN